MPPSDHEQLHSGTFRFLSEPSSPSTWFIFDLLAVAGIGLGVYSVLYVTTNAPLELFVGNAVVLIAVLSVLATTLTMVLVHSRYMLAEAGDFRLPAIMGMILVLAVAVATLYTIYEFYSRRSGFADRITFHLMVQIICLIVVPYYSATMKADLMDRLYKFTAHAGIAKLKKLRRARSTSDEERAELERMLFARKEELTEFDLLYKEHLELLRAAGNGQDADWSGTAPK